ncbi:tyrosine-protein phosphatase non-receptor type 18 [Discoglossus pictus]
MSQVSENLRGFLARVEASNRPGAKDSLKDEFEGIKTKAAAFREENNYTTEIGGSSENLKKNRYKDILPYDQTRVPVTLLAEEAGSDYINASFIQCLNNQKRYIATQGPLSHTVLDFWRMVWEYKVKVIVMACKEVEHGKRKCERYWPLDQGPSQFGPFTVNLVEKIRVNPEVVLRKMRVAFQREQRDITHFQYIAWPDRGIPDSYACFLEMIHLVRQYQSEDSTPICVHCSAGCGRTGVICTVEYIQSLLHKQRVPSNFSIFNVVLDMRCQRPSAVQTQEQYEFLYHAVSEMFQMELKNNPHYENLNENKAPLYDDARSVQKAVRTISHPRKETCSRLYTNSLPPDICTPEHPSRPPPDMATDTYAVVRKNRPTTSGIFSVSQTPPTAADARCQSTTGPQYDNVTPHTASPASLNQLYSTVTPKSNRMSVPASESITSSYALAGMPSTPEATSVEYAHVSHPRTVDTNSPSKSDNKWRQLQQSGVTPSCVRTDEYEDVKGQVPGLSASSSLGFNYRIGKPKGPRDPPAEWSR